MTGTGSGRPAAVPAGPPARAPGGTGGPPRAVTGRVVRTRPVAAGVVATELEAPAIAAAAEPLQFVQVRLPAAGAAGMEAAGGGSSGVGAASPGRPFLGRPLSIAGADPGTGRLTLVYRLAGPGTALLARLAPGAAVELLGPLGRPVRVAPPPPPTVQGPWWGGPAQAAPAGEAPWRGGRSPAGAAPAAAAPAPIVREGGVGATSRPGAEAATGATAPQQPGAGAGATRDRDRAAGAPRAPLWLVALGWQAVALRFLAARAAAAGAPVTALLAAEGEAAAALAADWSSLVPPLPAAGTGEPAGQGDGGPGAERARARALPGHLAIVPPRHLPALLAAALDGLDGVPGTDPHAAGAARLARGPVPGAGGPGPATVAGGLPAWPAGQDPAAGPTGGSARPRLFAAGPAPFLRQVQQVVRGRPVDAFLVVDAYMPCGYGACLACAVPLRDGAGTRYVRACREGRWFAAGEVVL